MIKQIPNILTLCNLTCGVLGLIAFIHYDTDYAAAFVFIAALFDFTDGLAARLLNARTEIGKQLDTLADMVSFGVLPSLLLFKLIDLSISLEYKGIGSRFHFDSLNIHYFALTAILIGLCAAIRLARFNIDTTQESYFKGLPTPAAALFIVSIYTIIYHYRTDLIFIIIKPYFLISVAIFISFMMISSVKLFTLKFTSFKWREDKIKYLFIVLSITALGLYQLMAIPFIIIGYILFSLIHTKFIKHAI